MRHALLSPAGPQHVPDFDEVVERFAESNISFSEAEALESSHWQMGEDALLREDVRFRPTPFGRWILASSLLANDALYLGFMREMHSELSLEDALKELSEIAHRGCTFCPADDRFVLEGGTLRLSAKQLTGRPLLEDDVAELAKYQTHLPVHSLVAAAASEPAGEWGGQAQEDVIETLGWVRVRLPGGNQLNQEMFVAQIKGHSMDDGQSGLVDDGFAVFELWPKGTKQHLRVLARGSFTDPETGSYAVKKYVGDTRDEEGRHHEIKLVSLNPDKERYPDILLQVEEEDDITVVAKVITALAPEAFARKPKPMRRPGRRDLDSEEGIEKIHARLAESADRFFEREAAESDEAAPKPETWNAQLVCLDAENGGLHIEIGPLTGLWGFIKKLNVKRHDGGESALVLASNARLRAAQVSVPPASGPWDWEAVGFEDDEDVDLTGLHTAVLAAERAWAFRVDAGGVGRQSTGTNLSPGQHYRLLCPQAIWSDAASPLHATPAGDGWQLIDCALPRTVTKEVREALEAIGFSLGEPQPKLHWAVTVPDVWQVNARGEPYACFEQSSPIVLAVTEYGGGANGDARLFVHGPSGAEMLMLPAGDEALIEMDGLEPGRYFCTVLHARTRVQPTHLPFLVESDLVTAPGSAWTVTWQGAETVGLPGKAVVPVREDLSAFDEGELPLELSGPHGWPVRALWKELGSEHLKQLFLDDDGELPMAGLLQITSERRRRSRHGDLILDLGELGRAALEHERRPDLASARAGLSERVAGGLRTAVEQNAGAFAQWFPQWHKPLCALLGYEAEWVNTEPGEVAPPVHAAIARLLVTERSLKGITRRCTRLLVMLDSLDGEPSRQVLDWIDAACRQHDDVRTALLTTGIKWTEHRINQRLKHKIWDLPTILEDDDQLLAFLRDVAEGM